MSAARSPPAPSVSAVVLPSSAASAPSPVATAAPRVRKAIIPIAGHGDRMFPASRVCANALMPLVDVDGIAKPILQIVIDEVLRAMEWEETTVDAASPSSPSASTAISIAVVVHPGSQRQQVMDYFAADTAEDLFVGKPELAKQARRMAAIGKMLHFVEQEKPMGSGHAILLCREWAGSDPFLVLLGDHVYLSSHPDRATNCARQLLDLHAFIGRNESGAMCSALSDCGEEDLPGVAVVQGSLVQGIDLYAAHAALQAQIRATHLKHGLDLARLELEVDGISRFKKQALPSSAPTPQTQGEIMRLTRLAERASADYASEHFLVAHSKMEFVCCMGIDLLGAKIFPVLQKQWEEIQAEAAAAAAKAEENKQQTIAASAIASPATASSSSSVLAFRPRPLQLREAMGALMSDSSAPAFFGLHVLGSCHDTGRPLSYAQTMAAFAEEARARKELEQDLAEIQHDKGTQAAASPSGVAASPTTPAAASPGSSPVVPLSNAALRQRAAYD